jgi:hypothetical protein
LHGEAEQNSVSERYVCGRLPFKLAVRFVWDLVFSPWREERGLPFGCGELNVDHGVRCQAQDLRNLNRGLEFAPAVKLAVVDRQGGDVFFSKFSSGKCCAGGAIDASG